MTQEELEQIEGSLVEAREAVAKGEALQRLIASDDYKIVFTDGYLNEYASELGRAIAKNTGEYDTDRLVENLKGINTFIGYTYAISSNYNAAMQTIRDTEEYIANSAEEE